MIVYKAILIIYYYLNVYELKFLNDWIINNKYQIYYYLIEY